MYSGRLLKGIISEVELICEDGFRPNSLKSMLRDITFDQGMPKNNIHLSVKAANLMNSISSNLINEYYKYIFVGSSKIKLDLFNDDHIYIYHGNASVAEYIKFDGNNVKTVQFNHLFENEHTVDLQSIVNDLKSAYKSHKLNEDYVQNLLMNSLHISIITKEENKLLKRSGRGTDFYAVIKNVYNKNGIQLVEEV